MSCPVLAAGLVDAANEAALPALREDYDALGTQFARRGLELERVTEAAGRFGVALPSWGVGTGGTRFARFPGAGEPRDIFDKLADCAVVHRLTAMTPRVSPHFPWDAPGDPAELRDYAGSLGLGFDAVNSNTFQDSPGQALSYKFGSLSHTDPAVRAQAIAHNLECIRLGESLGAKALTVWIGDGANFPGQQSLARTFERYLESVAEIYAALPSDWRLLLEYKLYEPAFYATVVQDWGSALLAAQATGGRAAVLVDLGHHAPGTNIEQVVARLIHAGRLGGFHLNDSKYGDDDLDTGAIAPYRLFLIFNELVDAARRERLAVAPAYMLDQSHNVTDPIESLLLSATEAARAYVQACLVDRAALDAAQATNDALLATQILKRAFTTDVGPILAMARYRGGGAIDPLAAYRASGYRAVCAASRPARAASGGGIV
jgi:L-rhamnose isomerase / sugar isomerase